MADYAFVNKDKVKDILDKDCYERIHDKNCKEHKYSTGCWCCKQNDNLVNAIMEAK